MLELGVKPLPSKIASGFHGGGGAFNIMEGGTKATPTGCMCGALAAGVLALSVLYGRTSPVGPRYSCISHLSGYLHQRFQEEMGAKCCALLRPFQHKIDEEKSCRAVYKRGAELAVEVALSGPKIASECKMPASLLKIRK